MKRLSLILIVICAGMVYVNGRDIGDISVGISPVADINDVKIVSYRYKVELPNGEEKIIESQEELTEKQYNDNYVTAVENKLKEIEEEVKKMTVKDNFDYAKPWSMYGKVIQYNYRMKLPDGTSQWINSDAPLKQEDCLKIVQNQYESKLKEDYYATFE